MRRITRFAALGLLLASLVALPLFLRSRPPAPGEIIKPPSEEWSGVLSVAVVQTWRPGNSSFAAYARKIANVYEKANPGVLIAIRELDVNALEQALSPDTAPDVLLFPGGALQSPSRWLLPLEGEFGIRQEYLASAMSDGGLYAIPFAAGGYGLLINGSIADDELVLSGANWQERLATIGQYGTIQCPAAEDGLFPAAGFLAMTGGAASSAGNALNNQLGKVLRVFAWPDFVLENKYAAYVGTQYDIERIKSLKAGGRAFDSYVLTSETAYSDMVMYAALPRSKRFEQDGERCAAAGRLLSQMTAASSRELLLDIRALPVDELGPMYADIPGMRELEEGLSGELYIANAFSSPGSRGRDAALAAAEGELGALGWRPALADR